MPALDIYGLSLHISTNEDAPCISTLQVCRTVSL